MKRLVITFIGLFIFVLLIAACGEKENNEVQPEFEVPTISDEEKLDEGELVVTVNDDEVTGVTYNLVYTKLKLHAVQTGQEISDEELKEMTIESLIDRQLLMQQAKEDGVVVTDDAATEELDRLKGENEEGFETLLEQYQITEKLFHQQLIFEMTMNEYLTDEIKVTVTDEEVEEAYEEAKKDNEDLPELVEIRDTLKSQLESQRTNDELQERIDNLKEKSEIERHL